MKSRSTMFCWIYILLATFVSSIALYYYTVSIPEIIPKDNLFKEIFMCSGQILWQAFIVRIWIIKEITSYIYQMITVSLFGSLALTPLIILESQIKIPLEIRVGLFLMIVLGMIIEHARRVKNMGFPKYLTYTWVLYRVFWLPILLF